LPQGATIFFNNPPVANRAPSVDFGPDLVLENVHDEFLQPKASDPDQDMLTWEIRDESGRIFATYPTASLARAVFSDVVISQTVWTGRAIGSGTGRSTSDGVFHVTPGTGTAPAWLRIARSGDRIDAFWSANGSTWNSLGFVSIPMADTVFVGLPVTSHNTAATATAVFDDVRIEQF
jgi:hypothetical protein